jgi:hypothetical protein
MSISGTKWEAHEITTRPADDARQCGEREGRLIVWCKACGHQVEPDPAEMVDRYGADTPVLDWRDRLVCSDCRSRAVDMVVTGTERR